ncbi:MAG TPA: LysM peptidoglycan-binding domain-containing protein [Anaerolineae bacterium]|nr:LysM peptidoglycan-binding domain-containing protein [Anaerolineae bacterium]
MSAKTKEKPTAGEVCPRCGTRLSGTATRCSVCGMELGTKTISGTKRRRSEITISIPLALILLAVFSLVSAGLAFAAVRYTGLGVPAEVEATPTPTPTVTATLLATYTATPVSTPTPLPPFEHTIASGDTCLALAAIYEVSVPSILNINPGLNCNMLSIGTIVLVPQPTPTASPMPTGTLSDAEATIAACPTLDYTVEANDTLSRIADLYDVSMEAIKEFNGMVTETVYEGQVLIIPLCRRLPTPGPTPTATSPPPHPAPNLLLPLDGEAFSLADDNVVLQWASVGELRDNEYYQVTVLDVTEGSGTVRLIDYTTDTKYIVPSSMRPGEAIPHVMRWDISTVRQTGTASGGRPIYQSAGSTSIQRVFTWSGASPEATPEP